MRGGRCCQGSGGGRRCFPRRAEEEEEISGFLMRGCRRAERWDYTARRQSCGLCVRAGLLVSARLPANRTFSAVKKKPRHCGRAQRCLCDCDMKRWRSLPSPSLPLGLHFLPNSFCLPVFYSPLCSFLPPLCPGRIPPASQPVGGSLCCDDFFFFLFSLPRYFRLSLFSETSISLCLALL